jgi:transposase-like protein
MMERHNWKEVQKVPIQHETTLTGPGIVKYNTRYRCEHCKKVFTFNECSLASQMMLLDSRDCPCPNLEILKTLKK